MIDKKSILNFIDNKSLDLIYNKELGTWFFHHDVFTHDTMATKLSDMDLPQWKEEAEFFLTSL